MNTTSHPACPAHRRGFALVVTLSLLILLTLIAIGLLSLSAVELRSASAASDLATARSNARLALQLALGDLQKHAGDDRRISAPGEVTGSSVNQPMWTGVWRSRSLDPDSPPTADEQSLEGKEKDFLKWLVSSPDPEEAAKQSHAATAGGEMQMLLSQNVLEPGAAEVAAELVPVPGIRGPGGSLAYAVMEEGTKARVDLGQAASGDDLAGRGFSLGTGQRPGIDRINGFDALPASSFDLEDPQALVLINRMISNPSAELGYESDMGSLTRRFHDLTVHSVGLLTDVAQGGFKKDINLLAESLGTGALGTAESLDPEFAKKNIYQSRFGLNLASDPPWEKALGFSNLHRLRYRGQDVIQKALQPAAVRNQPIVKAAVPTGQGGYWAAGTGQRGGPATLSRVEPAAPVLVPSIAKVQMVFSLAARDIYNYPVNSPVPVPDQYKRNGNSLVGMHGPWDRYFQSLYQNGSRTDTLVWSPYNYLLHMVYTPVITLHNPYNIPIEFQNLRVEFVNLPFAFRVFKNGVPQTNAMVPFSLMYGGQHGEVGGLSKRFGITLSNTVVTGNGQPTPITMLPGEVKVFSPHINPGLTWRQEVQSGTKQFWDWGNRNEADGRAGGGTATDTSRAIGVPGWRGASVGYDLDWLCPTGYRTHQSEPAGANQIYRWFGVALKHDDEVHVEFAPLPDPKLPDKKFTLEMTLVTGASAVTTAPRTSVIEFDFETITGLQETLMTDENPQAENGRIRFPEGTDTLNVMRDLFDHSTVALRDIKNTTPFAVFSAYAKTTMGGYDRSGDDGLYPAKPFCFQNHTVLGMSQNVRKEHPSHHSHELNVSRFRDTMIEIQGNTNRGMFISGHSSQMGRRFGTLYEIPLGPLQNLTTLNGAHLAASFHLPHFSAPVGNSYGHPLIQADRILTAGPAGYTYADHSYLLNSVLFDGFYCSGFQSRSATNRVGDGTAATELIEQFVQGESPLTDRRLLAHLADGATRDEVVAKLSGSEGFRHAAAHQLMQGAFNVNSTSVEAWKAMLSSMRGEEVLALLVPPYGSADMAAVEATLDPPADDRGARFSRFRLPNAQPGEGDADAFWHGPRDLSESELGRLAQEVVNQVKERGPFLSVGEFVNRQLGPAGPKTLKGALQAAIDDAGLNGDANSHGYEITMDRLGPLEMPNPEALLGPSAQGAPGYLMQADLLAVLGNAVTVRSDTFVIRAYGDARNAAGKITARAWCEAVVQRMPEYLDSADSAEVAPADLTSEVNRLFGRRYLVRSFRWLSPQEI